MKSKSEVVRQAKRDGKSVHFANLLDLCHLKNEEGYRAVITEQGASASQMAAARFVDTISKLLDTAGEATDAVFSVHVGQDD